MRTTLNLEDHLLRQAKVLAAESGRTLTSLIEEGLRRVIAAGRTEPGRLEPLPTHRGSGVRPGVDLTNNARTLDIMDGLA